MSPFARGKLFGSECTIGELPDGGPIALPVMTIGGVRPGPTLFLQAGMHGDELTGIAICRGAIAGIDPKELAGTVVAIPVANVPAHLTRTRGFLHEERWLIDINRIFPGNPHGLMTERTANVLMDEFARARRRDPGPPFGPRWRRYRPVRVHRPRRR